MRSNFISRAVHASHRRCSYHVPHGRAPGRSGVPGFGYRTIAQTYQSAARPRDNASGLARTAEHNIRLSGCALGARVACWQVRAALHSAGPHFNPHGKGAGSTPKGTTAWNLLFQTIVSKGQSPGREAPQGRQARHPYHQGQSYTHGSTWSSKITSTSATPRSLAHLVRAKHSRQIHQRRADT